MFSFGQYIVWKQTLNDTFLFLLYFFPTIIIFVLLVFLINQWGNTWYTSTWGCVFCRSCSTFAYRFSAPSSWWALWVQILSSKVTKNAGGCCFHWPPLKAKADSCFYPCLSVCYQKYTLNPIQILTKLSENNNGLKLANTQYTLQTLSQNFVW